MNFVAEKNRVRPKHFRLDDPEYFASSEVRYRFEMLVSPPDLKTLGCVYSGLHHVFVAEVFSSTEVRVPSLGGTTMMELLGLLIEPGSRNDGASVAIEFRPVWCRALNVDDAFIRAVFERVIEAFLYDLEGKGSARTLTARAHREMRRMTNQLAKNAKRIVLTFASSATRARRSVVVSPR